MKFKSLIALKQWEDKKIAYIAPDILVQTLKIIKIAEDFGTSQ